MNYNKYSFLFIKKNEFVSVSTYKINLYKIFHKKVQKQFYIKKLEFQLKILLKL